MQHPYTLAHFETEYPSIPAFIDRVAAQIAAGKRNIGAKAPVKSGKRNMVEVSAVKLAAPVKYVTSLNRKDVKSQQAELASYGVVTHVMDRKGEKPGAAIHDIRSALASSPMVILCFDECDYGSGTGQVVEPVFREFLDDRRVVKVYFSATFHETTFSARDDFVMLEYVPPKEVYCGAEYFLTNNLVFDPLPFFDYDDGTLTITPHARQVLRESITASRHIGVVRVPGKGTPMSLFKDDDKRKVLEQQLTAVVPGKPWKIVPVDDQSPFDWENDETLDGHTTKKNYLFVIKQTCTRGTDLKGWHPKLAFWHDTRPAPKANLNTTIQAFLRPSHYTTMPGYNGAQPIRLYVDRRVIQVAVDDDMDAYLRAGGKAPARTKVSKIAPWTLSKDTFRSVEEAREYGEAHYGGKCYPRHLDENNEYPYRGKGGKAGRRKIVSEEDTRNMELGEGVKDAARIIPFLRSGAGDIGYLIAYSIDSDASSVSSGSTRSIALKTTKKSIYNEKK
jgi:hypothetical protein